MTQAVRIPAARSAPGRSRPRRSQPPPAAPPARVGVTRWSWPLAAICLGLPAWWLLGFGTTILMLMALPMLWQLRRNGPVLVPKGFGLWLMFLVVIAISSLTLLADAPGAVKGGGFGRISSWALFTSYYLAATVVLLWVGNLDERKLPAISVARLVGWLYVISTVGGWLGLLYPNLHLVSALELLLPGGLRHNPLVQELAHPVTAQVQDVLGFSSPRPAAPYAFTNAWGANTVVYLPFFVVGWLPRGSGWRRPAGLVVLAASLVPIIYSLNRGMWIGILFSAALATVHLALRGRFGALIGMTAGAAVIAVGVLATPLGETVVERLQHPHSNTRRADLATGTLQSAMASPVVGFGSTRPVQGNFVSVAQGKTADCPKCQVPPYGTHGQLYRLVFTTGLLGAGLYFAFFGVRLWRHARSRDPLVLAAWVAAATSVLFTLYYNVLPHALYVVFAGLGLAWRLDREAARQAREAEQAALGVAGGVTPEPAGRRVVRERR
jgi:hypothetical protein